MADYKRQGGFGGRFNKGGGRPKFGGHSGFRREGGRNGGDRPQMFSAVCAACNKTCEVPFRPTGDKPVYCKDCFHSDSKNKESYSNDRRPATSFSQKPQVDDRRLGEIARQLESINSKLDSILRIIEVKPSKPALETVIENVLATDKKKTAKPTKKPTKKKLVSKSKK